MDDSPSRQEIKQRIAAFEKNPKSVDAAGIAKYTFNGEPFWLIVPRCCDRFNFLYNAEGIALCAPSGGITGRGTGHCPSGIKPYPGGGLLTKDMSFRRMSVQPNAV